jgi:4-azaleucine resistance transporter AzlC
MFKILKKAFPYTIPVLLGYSFLGIAYGLLISDIGLPPYVAALISLIVYAGSLQFALIPILQTPIAVPALILLTLSISFRHLFYGLTLIDQARKSKSKLFFIHGLSDETYALISTLKAPEGIKEEDFYLAISFLNYFYRALFSWLGAIFGNLFQFNTLGLDFVLVALFVALFTEQRLSTKNHLPAILGMGISIVSILLFGKDKFMIPAMVIILLSLIGLKDKIVGKKTQKRSNGRNNLKYE